MSYSFIDVINGGCNLEDLLGRGWGVDEEVMIKIHGSLNTLVRTLNHILLDSQQRNLFYPNTIDNIAKKLQ